MSHIVILTHAHDTFEAAPYFLREIAQIWRQEGLRVTVINGPRGYPDADLAILHVDLTVVPAAYQAVLPNYPLVLNRHVTNISKRQISANLVRRGEGYLGPVIVKTNRNTGGHREARLAKSRPLMGRCLPSLRQKLPWSFRAKLPTSEYPIFESASQVPRTVWYNPDLVVERFLPEQRNGHYCLRTWIFLGDQETNSVCYSDQPIIKSHNVLRREAVAEVPDDLRTMRRHLNFDFGKFDYAIVNNRTVLYDANRTPMLGNFSREELLPNIRVLAQGVRAYW